MKFEGFKDYFLETEPGVKIKFQTNFAIGQNLDNAIIFNYGLVCSNYHWKEQLSFFNKNYNILIYDYRGHYESTCNTLDEINFKNFVKDLKAICDHCNIKSAHHIGHSMGVSVTLEYYKRFSKEVKSMVLISGTAVPVYNTMFNSNIFDQLAPLLNGMYKKFPTTFDKFWKTSKYNPLVKKIVHIGGFNINEVSDSFISIYLEKLGELGPKIFLKLLHEMNNHHILDFLAEIKVPTLIIGGDKDKVIPNRNQRLLQEKIKDSQLFIVKDGSHVPQIDFPTYINERISLFYQKLKESKTTLS
ncbi:MAG: alpha/beta hydrolase [Bacteriovoracaceae bacterium]|jgi:pimeloyl-ACP methyl ester carboxylesterase|nr:alpha/beta hydrolase [Bacteriovoracaceae bacterium]